MTKKELATIKQLLNALEESNKRAQKEIDKAKVIITDEKKKK